ncbi:hypothetical protein FRC01_000983 [Tulasnella sp. 417]|nr:hypothetical protein FRC01_000983 [Tulasnella sp. 417]
MAEEKRRTSTTATETSGPNEIRSTKAVGVDPMAVPELLDGVLSFATLPTLASCAVVCQRWSQVALDRLWKQLDSILPLLELVTSLEMLEDIALRVPDALEALSDDLSEADWSRFHYYANRVRTLSYSDRESHHRGSTAPKIVPEAIAMLCLHHPADLTILPHLEVLKWCTKGSVAPILPFLSSQVKSLEVELTGDSPSINSFFYALGGRNLNLKAFTLQTPTRAMKIEESLQKAIRTWKNLETLKVPPYYLRPSILNATSSLPNLTVLQIDYTHHNPYDEAAVVQKLPENAFPQLESFGFNCDPASAQTLVQRYPGLFSKLTSVHIGEAGGINDKEVSNFLRCLGEKCAQLASISLNFRLGSGRGNEEVSPLTFKVLEHLFPCEELQVLEIGHPYPITFNETDVERMGAAWPELTVLNICNEPHSTIPISGDMGNSLHILSAFAKYLPLMEDLGLTFAEEQVPRFSGDLYPSFEFHTLDTLRVGVSAVPGGRLQDVGFLIASLCRVKPTIESGVSNWFEGIEPAEWSEYERQWEETNKCLEFAMRTKISGREKFTVAMD